MRVIDLSLPIADGMPVYPGDPEVRVKVSHTYGSHGWELRELELGSHTGTHVDAPSHMHAGAATLDELPLERFFGVSRLVRVADLAWPEGRGLFFGEAVGLACFDRLAALRPRFVGGGLSEELERALLGIGIVTYTGLQGLELLPSGSDFMFYGFPLRIAGGDGSPVRAVAMVEDAPESVNGEPPDPDLFMMCASPNKSAFRALPEGIHVRRCKPSELDVWKAFPFDDAATAEQYRDFMTGYFNEVYAAAGDLFFQQCLLACDENDNPVGTCMIWKAYGKVNTVHWFKVVKAWEGKGLGRALLSVAMEALGEADYPVYLHTQTSSFRAVKLYSDFGFALLSDPVVGYRRNDLDGALRILEREMAPKAFGELRIEQAPKDFLDAVLTSKINQF